MEIKTAKDLKDFFNSLTDEQLKLKVLFDTEGKSYDYHMAEIGSIYCEDDTEALGPLVHIGLHEKSYDTENR